MHGHSVSPQADGILGIGYLLWIFGFMGAHRFYYGRPVSGTIWFQLRYSPSFSKEEWR